MLRRASNVALSRSDALPWIGAVLMSAFIGRTLAQSSSPGILVAVVLMIAAVVVTLALGSEHALAVLLVTAPIGLEPLTQNQRNLLPAFGGWALSSLRLGVFLTLVVGLIALRGLPRRLTTPERLYLAGVIWLTLMLALSPSLIEGIRFTAKLAALPAAWIGFHWVIRRFGANAVWRLLHWALVLAVVANAFLYLSGIEISPGSVETERFGGIVGSPASGALSVALLSLVALYRWFTSRHAWSLLLYGAAWFFVFVSITRIAMIAFFLGSCVLATLVGRRQQALVLATVVVCAAFAYAPLRERMAWGSAAGSWGGIYETYRQHGTANLNLEGRFALWKPLWREFTESPIVGSGTGASAEVLRETSRAFGNASVVTQAHSDYLALLTNGGVVALGLWFGGLAGLIALFRRVGGAGAVAVAGLVMYLTAAITDNAIEMYANVGIPLGAIIALAFATRDSESA